MKKSRLLNSEISYEISKLGHTDHITVCDAGLPISESVKRIDLAIERNIPPFIDVLDPILEEMMVEEIILATEILEHNLFIYDEIKKLFIKHNMKPKITLITHEEFKVITKKSKAIIRSGECSPYANIILKSGVVF
ncbi:D-ribose pyranase [Cetobacterium ceti]|uniref:D-ribose pyranase n=1 Tax=Cetobacterium ceti TaxID=180163 RepID=A0A1T4QPD2_9FUSO|nr:D-ribose pyranase [Cetobacterium ceti]SKA05620.1 D-ribose pyranase [Cetobacterium ceti]